MSAAFQAALAESLDQHVKELQEQLAALKARAEGAEASAKGLSEDVAALNATLDGAAKMLGYDGPREPANLGEHIEKLMARAARADAAERRVVALTSAARKVVPGRHQVDATLGSDLFAALSASDDELAKRWVPVNERDAAQKLALAKDEALKRQIDFVREYIHGSDIEDPDDKEEFARVCADAAAALALTPAEVEKRWVPRTALDDAFFNYQRLLANNRDKCAAEVAALKAQVAEVREDLARAVTERDAATRECARLVRYVTDARDQLAAAQPDPAHALAILRASPSVELDAVLAARKAVR